MKPKRKYKIFLCIALPVFILLIAYIVWGNSAITVSELNITDANIPAAFNGYKIAHISDLHSASFGKDNERLLTSLAETYPDIIVITGDLFDYRWGDISIGMSFAEECVRIAPTYFVSGNHESDGYEYADISSALRKIGVTVLDDERAVLTKSGEQITLIGLLDYHILYDNKSRVKIETVIRDALSGLRTDSDGYTILLAHRPEQIDIYASYGVNIVFSGHAHGGQFRLPLIGGIYAPGQGLFPKYTAGLHTVDNTNIVISRGLGNSGFPFRFNNRPEIVVATLECE